MSYDSHLKGKVMQIEKTLTDNGLKGTCKRILKISHSNYL